MDQESTYFAAVQAQLHCLGQAPAMTADERDLADDYEQQQFGVAVCAADIAKARK